MSEQSHSLPPPAMPLSEVSAPVSLSQEEQLQKMKQLEEKMLEQNRQREEMEKQIQKRREEMEKNLPRQQQPIYTELSTVEPTPTPTPTCRPCRNRGMMMLLAIVLLAAIIYLIFNGDKLFEASK